MKSDDGMYHIHGHKYPMLIGRRFLNKFKYMVNVRKKNINDRAKAL